MNPLSRFRSGGFTLIEILVVLAIIATLAAIVLPTLFKAGEYGEKSATRVHIQQLEVAIKTYESSWGDYPPSSFRNLKPLKIDTAGANAVNQGPEALVLALSTERKNGPFTEWQEDYLENCDEDKLSKPPSKSSIKKADLFEVVDFWGNPLIYIHCRDYGKRMKYIDGEGNAFTVTGQKSKKLGDYHNPNSYQLWSIGVNGLNENGKGDDIVNFTTDPDEDDEKDEGPP